jgi:ornithine carbamoyltransferase
MKIKSKDLLTLDELSDGEIKKIIDLGIKLKKEKHRGKEKPLLKNKTIAMIFEKPSTRTRISFDAGIYQLGGHAIYLSSNELQLSRGESLQDTAKTMSRYVDLIMARVYDHKTLETLSKNSSIPVINGLSDSFHPCQILADLMTIKEKKKKLKGLKIAWVGDGNNVCNSLIYGCSKSKIKITVATPNGFEPDMTVVRKSKKYTDVTITNEPTLAVKDADIVMTDTFVSIHTKNPEQSRKFLPKFQVNSSLMKKAKKNALFMHCLPAKRTHEVSEDVIDGPQSIVWDQAENRLHVQKALMLALLGI